MTALDNLATALAEKGETDKEKLIQAIRQREQQRRTAKKLSICKGN
jgi:mannitol/fructose-specific phosphotransferase system IIA component (Ntr-type)